MVFRAALNLTALCLCLGSLADSAALFELLESIGVSFFGSAGGLAGLGLAEEGGVGTVSPEDVAAEGSGDGGIDRVEQVDECEREVNERAHAKDAHLIGAAAGPREHRGPKGTGILKGTGQHVAAKAHLIILVNIQRSGNTDAEELVAHGGIAEDGGDHRGNDQGANGVELVLEAAEQALNAAAALKSTAVSDSEQNQVDSPHGAVHTLCFAKNRIDNLIASFNCAVKTVVQEIKNTAERNAIRPDSAGLENNGNKNSRNHRNSNADQAGHFQDTHGNNDDQRNEDEDVDVEVGNDGILNALCNAGIISRGVNIQTENGIDHEGNEEGRAGGGDHRGHVIEQTGVGNAGSEVGGVGQGGELIADIGTGDNHTGGQCGVDAEASTDAEEGKTDGRSGGPG